MAGTNESKRLTAILAIATPSAAIVAFLVGFGVKEGARAAQIQQTEARVHVVEQKVDAHAATPAHSEARMVRVETKIDALAEQVRDLAAELRKSNGGK